MFIAVNCDFRKVDRNGCIYVASSQIYIVTHSNKILNRKISRLSVKHKLYRLYTVCGVKSFRKVFGYTVYKCFGKV